MAEAAARQNVIRQVYEESREGFGSIADTLRLARRRDPSIRRADVQRFMQGLRVREDRPQRGYNSYVPTEPMHQLQVDLADMSVFSTAPYRYMLVAINVFSKRRRARPCLLLRRRRRGHRLAQVAGHEPAALPAPQSEERSHVCVFYVRDLVGLLGPSSFGDPVP